MTLFISPTFITSLSMLLGGGGDKQKHEERKQERKSAWFTYTFICFVSCLLSTALVTFKKIASRRCYECTCNGCWFVFLRKRDFQPWSVVAFGECKRVFDTILLFFCISSIPFLLFFGMIFLSKKNCVLYWNSILDNCSGRFYLIMWSNDVTSAEVLCSVKRQRCIVVVSTSI